MFLKWKKDAENILPTYFTCAVFTKNCGQQFCIYIGLVDIKRFRRNIHSVVE